MTPQQIADEIARLSVSDLDVLRELLRGMPGWGGAGARQPVWPTPPLDARGIALDSERGKTATR